ncbi:MAG: hypothetical protein QM762_14560 [Chryseolinea sp.]
MESSHASFVSGYDYDIFVSYRHKDNKGEHWVSEFVNALKTELEATFKEDISIYFDENPHDGLLETHDVSESLKGKLKCLIFIPIISQTYCDPKSFAWQHEFLAFKKLAGEDQFGLKVKLHNGNVASRILPVRIHELDADDRALLESELGPVRAIDLIFKSPGVNRPLRSHEDHPDDNQDKTFYRNQINKMANAIKEIIVAINSQDRVLVGNTRSMSPARGKPLRVGRYFVVSLVALLFIVGYFVYQQLSISKGHSPVDKSIAVLPFDNLSDDKTQEYFSDGMMDEILNQLVKVRDLKVISRRSSMNFKHSEEPLKSIASQLGVQHVLEGSVRKDGDRVRISVKLINADSDQQLWSETYDRELKDIFVIQTEISKNIAKELKAIISPEELSVLERKPTNSQVAYDYYLKARQLSTDLIHHVKIVELCSKAIETDPDFSLAYIFRCWTYAAWYYNRFPGWENTFELAKTDFEKAKDLSAGSVELRIVQGDLLHYSRRYEEAIASYEKLIADYKNYADIYTMLASSQRRLGRWREARLNHEKAISLDPGNLRNYVEMARFCLITRDYSKGYEYAVKAGVEPYKELLLFGMTGDPNVFKARPDWGYLYKREFDHILTSIDTSKSAVREGAVAYYPKALDFAEVYYLKKERGLAKQYALEAIPILKEKLKESANDDRLFASLSLAYAYAGRRTDAILHAKKAVQMVPIRADAFGLGPAYEENLVYVYIICEEYDLAIDKLQWLLTIPGNLSAGELKLSPWFDAVRDLSRFQKILNTKYETKL